VRRPLTGALIERWGEAPQLRRADVVACVSQEVAHEAERLGVRPERLVVAPMAVDPERFHPGVQSAELREQFHELGDFVFGWVGSFRQFHAIDHTVAALRHLRDAGCSAGLVLVGDGPDRQRVQALADELGVRQWVRFHGQCTNPQMPQVLAALDTAVLTAESGQQFHYSPLKLREYMAMGLPVVAPRLGEMARYLADGESALLYEAGDSAGLGAALARLAENPSLGAALGEASRDLVLATGTWDVVMASTLQRLGL
jgi:glycosyltransferase involved in cell wall biosynthesis